MRPSLDRIDRTKGYVPGNVQLVTWRYNEIKGRYDDDELLQFAAAILDENFARAARSAGILSLVGEKL